MSAKLRRWMAWRARWWAADGLTIEAIAMRFGCSPSTVRDLLRLTRRQPTEPRRPRASAPAKPASTAFAARGG